MVVENGIHQNVVAQLSNHFYIPPPSSPFLSPSPPLTVPGVPRNLTASDITSVAITVSWSPPEITNGIIISYYVNVTGPDNIISANAMTSARSYVATILTPFTNYTFRVAAMTSAGIGMGTVLTVATAQDGKMTIIIIFCDHNFNEPHKLV